MRTSDQRCLVLLACLAMALTGCDMTPVAERSDSDASASPDTVQQNDTTPANPTTTSNETTTSPPSSPTATGTESSSTGGTATTPATGTASSSTGTTTTPATGTTTTPPTSTTTTPATGDDASGEAAAELPGAALIEGLNNQRATNAFQQIRDALAADPDNVNAQIQLMILLQQVGMELMRSDTQKGHDAFLASAQVADSILEKDSDIPPAVSGQFGTVFYNQACVLALRGDAAEALNVLDKSMQWGFQDLQLLKTDSDLSSVRDLPEFAAKLESWETKIAEAARQHAEDLLAQGETFPFDFAVTDIQGNQVKLSDYRGKVVIVDIWGTWCPPCRAEIPSFVELQQKYGPEGFQMIGLNYERVSGEEAEQLVKNFVSEFSINYPCAMGDPAIKDQVPSFEGYPTTLFIDKTGKVRLKVVGAHPYSFLEALVTTLLEEPGPEGTSATGG